MFYFFSFICEEGAPELGLKLQKFPPDYEPIRSLFSSGFNSAVCVLKWWWRKSLLHLFSGRWPPSVLQTGGVRAAEDRTGVHQRLYPSCSKMNVIMLQHVPENRSNMSSGLTYHPLVCWSTNSFQVFYFLDFRWIYFVSDVILHVFVLLLNLKKEIRPLSVMSCLYKGLIERNCLFF